VNVGFFSPLPPARTGVADYSAALFGALKSSGASSGGVVLGDGDINLYHLGNNQLHGEIYQRALEKPGVAVLHDAVLQHFFLGSLSEQDYVREFIYNYGAWNEDQARELWRGRARSASDPQYFRYPMLKRVAERSLALIVHNPAARAMVKAHVPGAVIHEIPHLLDLPEPPERLNVDNLRRTLGIREGTFLFGVFGHLRESKRLAAVLRAFHRACAAADIALLVAGDFVSKDLERALEPLLRAEGISRIGYTPERDFWLHAAAVDACINLRYPTAGETSGISIRLMGIAKPVLMSACLEAAGFPDSSCLRVDAGPAEEDMLVEFMVWLARFPRDARAIGEKAAAHIREFHNPERVAEMYWQVIRDCQSSRLLS
jgi:glycosyltransferase involved in cell wall biosynthesis